MKSELERVAAQDRRIKNREIGARSIAEMLHKYLPKRTAKAKKEAIFREVQAMFSGIVEAEIMEYRCRLREMSEEVDAANARARKAERGLHLDDNAQRAINRGVKKALVAHLGNGK